MQIVENGILYFYYSSMCVMLTWAIVKSFYFQPRYLLTSLALNDLFTGILIAPVALFPALYKCWPYGEIFCQIQVCTFFNCYQGEIKT